MRISDWSSDVCSSDLDLFDRKLRFNVAIFHAWQSDVQRNIRTFDPVFQSLTSYTTNAGKARSYGAEFEATVLPWKGMEVTGSLSLLRAKYVKGTFNETQIICVDGAERGLPRSEEHTSELQSLMRISYAVFCLKKNINKTIK